MWNRESIYDYRELKGNRNGAVGIAAGYWLDNRGSEFESRQGKSILHIVKTGSGAQKTPMQLVLGVKQPGREVDHSPRILAEVKKTQIGVHPLQLHGILLN
jgi:hypothetical protein